MGANDRRIEHLNEMRRSAHGGERIEEGFEHAGFAQAVEALPDAVPMAEALRQSAPSHVLDREEMQRFEEQPVILGFAPASRQAGAKHQKSMRPIFLIHFRRHGERLPIRSEAYESRQIQRGNPKNIGPAKFVHTA